MQYQPMRKDSLITEEADHRKLKKLANEPCRWVQHSKKLKELPPKYLDFRDHEHIQIDISYNKTLDIERTFEQLTDLKPGLKGIGYSKNQAPKFPDRLFQLTNLEEIEWRSNGLREIPEEFACLEQLKHLNLRHNNLKHFPKTILKLKGLKTLILRFNKFGKLPDEICELTELEHLDVSGCALSDLPESIGKLKNLRILEIEGNQLTKLPDSFLQLEKLETVNLKNNPELDLSLYIELLAQQKATQLNLYDHGLNELPDNIGLISSLENALRNSRSGTVKKSILFDRREFIDFQWNFLNFSILITALNFLLTFCFKTKSMKLTYENYLWQLSRMP